MGRDFQEQDGPHFDYRLETLEQSPGCELRGPLPDFREPYFVCIGGSHVFGRFCNEPFPALLSKALQLPVLNLGISGQGPQAFLDDRLLGLINGARFAVVDIVSARIGSNSGFVNSPSGRRDGERLRDGKKMSLERFLEEEMKTSPHHEVTRLLEETRDSWVGHYRSLLSAITVPRVLHWFSTVTPYRVDNFATLWKLLGRFPQLVNGRMVAQLRPFCEAYVETVCRQGLPQKLWKADEKMSGTTFSNGRLFNDYFPSPEMHVAAAKDLQPVCRIIDDRLSDAGANDERIVVVAQSTHDAAAVADLCAGRAGCYTYRQLLDDTGLLSLLTLSKTRILHVRRRNLLEGYLSDLQGQPTHEPEVCGDRLAAGFTTHVQSVIGAEKLVALHSRGSALLEVFTEDLRLNPGEEASRIAAFIREPSPREATIQAALRRLSATPSPDCVDKLRPVFERISLQFS